MTEVSPSVISIGYGRHMFVDGNTERLRMEQCASHTAGLHMVIFTRSYDRLRTLKATDTLSLYPSSSISKLTMVWDAFLIARSIIKKNSLTDFIVTTQDSFEAGIVGFILKKFYGVKLVVQEHGGVFGTPYWREESTLNQIRYRVGLRILAAADVIRVVSKRDRDYFASLGMGQITTLPVVIDTTSFTQAVSSPHVQQIFSNDSFVFLSVARFVPQKNLLMLIRAFAKAQATHSRARLLLVGRGSEEKNLKLEAERLFGVDQKIVVFLPWSEDVAGLMKACDAYALSSHYEGWGRVLIEAMVAGLPIVTTDVGCAGEVVQDRVHGLVTPLNDEDAFAEALAEMIGDKMFFENVKDTLAELSIDTIPGTDRENYGSNWVKTLTY
jgi:glycosyltransferase involved in cell wall biosynthesis